MQTDHAHLVIIPSGTIDIIFNHAAIAPGVFNLFKTALDGSNSVLFLGTSGNDWYQSGIPGHTRSIPETAEWLRAIVKQADASTVRMHGMSMGAYAACLYGALIDATVVYAANPEMQIGEWWEHSYVFNEVRVFSEDHVRLGPFLKRASNTRFQIVYSIFDWYEHVNIAKVFTLFILVSLVRCGLGSNEAAPD